MPQVSPADCVPILQRELARLVAFVDEQQGSIGRTGVSDATWVRFADAIEQMRNVHGCPEVNTLRRIEAAVTAAGLPPEDCRC